MASIPPQEIKARLKDLRSRMKAAGLDAYIVESRPNTAYLSGFTGTSSLIFVTARSAWFLTDFRYIEVARREIPELKVVLAKETLSSALGELVAGLSIQTAGFEGTLSYHAFTALRKAVRPVRLKVSAILDTCRRFKSALEIQKLQNAQRQAEKIFEYVLEQVQPGVTELELRHAIVHSIDHLGLDGPSFEPIIASGANSSHPHHHPGKRKLTKNDVITIDMGVIFDGYCSDMTRTVFLGKPTRKMVEIYHLVLEAQERGIAAVRDGVKARAVDKAVRDTIDEAGYGEYFGHGTGHGVGLEIHEDPYANTRTRDTLSTGMSLTIEPGIYLPGKFGVRIEDTVIVQPDGALNLMSTPKEMVVL